MKLQPGDQVAYSAAFLKSIGCQTGEMPFRRGSFIEYRTIGQRQLASVQWQDADEPQLVLPNNLAKPGPNIRYCSC